MLASTAAPQSQPSEPAKSPAATLADKLFGSKLMEQVHLGLFYQLENAEQKPANGLDVAANPGKYTARERFIAYLDLQLNKVKYEKFSESFRDNGYGINNGKEIEEDFKNALEILGSDPEVQDFMTKATFNGFRKLFSGEQLSPVDTEGKTGAEIMEAQLQRSQDMQDLRKEIIASFHRDIVEGGLLEDGLKAGKDAKTIMEEYSAALGVYSMVLPDASYFDNLAPNSGVWPTASYDESMKAAEKKYAEFFAKNFMENLPDTADAMEGLWRAGKGAELDPESRKGLGSVIPIVDTGHLGLGGKIFDGISVDYTALQAAAKRDFYWKEGDGVSNLFKPTVEIMAQQYYGSDPSKKAERDLFVSTVLKELDPLLQLASTGKMSSDQLHQRLARLSFAEMPAGTNIHSYRNIVGTALEGLLFGASMLSGLPDNPDGGSKASGLGSYSVNDIVASITVATGLAGQGVSVSGRDAGNDRFMSSSAMADVAKTMFGTTEGGWSKAVLGSAPSSMANEFWTGSLKKMSGMISAEVKEKAPDISVVAPTIATQQEKEADIKRMFAPTISALSEAYFSGNEKAMEAYTGNLTTIATAMWSLMRPGGNFETLKGQISEYIDKNVTTAPEGVGLAKYKEALISGASAIFQGSRAIWAGTRLENPTWDTIAILVLHSTASLAAVLNMAGEVVEKSKFSLGSLLNQSDELAAAQSKATGSILKGTGKILGGFAGVVWAPVDFYQFYAALKDGKTDVGSLIFMGIGSVADTIGAIEGLAGLGEMLMKSNFIRGTTTAAAPARFLPPMLGSMFTTAAIIGWAAWAGMSIYQVALREKEFNKRRDAVDNDLSRLLGNKLSLYDIKSDSQDKNGVPYKDDDAERVHSPVNWAEIKEGVNNYRRENGFGEFTIPTS